MTRRRAIWIGVLLTLLVAGAVLGGREGTGERGPSGTAALRRMLATLGYDVREAIRPPPPPATFVLLVDFRGEDETASLQQWVEAGGRLVVADPESATVATLGIEPAGRIGTIGPSKLRPGCVSSAVAGVGSIAVGGGAPSLTSFEPAGIGCFPASRGSFMVSIRAGDGIVIALGDPSPLTNELLARSDNAAFAVALLGAGGPIVFGTPVVAGAADPRPGGLWRTLPPPAKAVALQLMLAVVLFALVRGRRLGRPVAEDAPSPIPAGELVRATARLLRQAKAVGHAGRLMRNHLARRVAARLGYGSDEMLKARAAELGERAHHALAGPDAATDAELIDLGVRLEETRKELEGVDR